MGVLVKVKKVVGKDEFKYEQGAAKGTTSYQQYLVAEDSNGKSYYLKVNAKSEDKWKMGDEMEFESSGKGYGTLWGLKPEYVTRAVQSMFKLDPESDAEILKEKCTTIWKQYGPAKQGGGIDEQYVFVGAKKPGSGDFQPRSGSGGPVRAGNGGYTPREPLMTDVEARAKLTAEKHDGMLAVLCGICRLSVEEAEAKIREKVLDDFVNIGSTIGTSVFMGLMRGEFTKTHRSAADEMPESQVDPNESPF